MGFISVEIVFTTTVPSSSLSTKLSFGRPYSSSVVYSLFYHPFTYLFICSYLKMISISRTILRWFPHYHNSYKQDIIIDIPYSIIHTINHSIFNYFLQPLEFPHLMMIISILIGRFGAKLLGFAISS